MKKIKMKDTILSHYQKVHELEMDGIAVRVFKPRTMQQLPAHMMLHWIKYRAGDAIDWMKTENTTCWCFGNPDYGLWDAQTVYHYDPRGKAFNIYFASILVRPYSREAYENYCRQHECIEDVNQQLMVMFDSREFDRIHGFDTSYGSYKNQDEADAIMYRVVDKERDIADHSPYFYIRVVDVDEESPVQRCGVKFKQLPDGRTEYNATTNGHEAMERGGTELMHDCAKVFTDFRKEHPEVTEIHFYTDDEVKVNE